MPSTPAVIIVIELFINFISYSLTVGLLLVLASATVPLAIGVFTLYHLLRSKVPPADTSNRINHIRLWWFALTREDKFVGQFEWLKKDEWENVNNKNCR